jgi:hypothetical protein
MLESEHEAILGMNGLVFGAIIILAGFGIYCATAKLRSAPVAAEPSQGD